MDYVDIHEAGRGTYRQAPLILQNPDMPVEKTPEVLRVGKIQGEMVERRQNK